MNETQYGIARQCFMEIETVPRMAFGLPVSPDARMKGRVLRFSRISTDYNGTTVFIDGKDGSVWRGTPADGFGRCRCRALDRLIRIEARARRQGFDVRWRIDVTPSLSLSLIAGFGESRREPALEIIKSGAVVQTIV